MQFEIHDWGPDYLQVYGRGDKMDSDIEVLYIDETLMASFKMKSTHFRLLWM